MKTEYPGPAEPATNAPRHGARRAVVLFSKTPSGNPDGHEAGSQARVAQRLAALLGHDFAGEHEAGRDYGAPLFVVPRETLADPRDLERLGIRDERDLFGGVVPHPFVATKLITHPLPHAVADAPAGWSRDFGERVRDVVLPGYSAFSLRDALAAGRALLGGGAVRIKDPGGIGGSGQSVAENEEALRQRLDEIGERRLREEGVVLERNLGDVITRSVGQVRLGEHLASYCGIQHLTKNNAGREVYGGSDLLVARGDFEALLALDHDDAVRAAVAKACTYHRAALASFPGMIVSRANYDVAEGRDDSGQALSGVLEQSWRIGGATGAELAALEAFAADPALGSVRASTREVYGDGVNIPGGATVYFQGNDRHVGPITKYTTIEPHANT
jgi:hypothetical protein